MYAGCKVNITNAGQDAPRIHAGEEWPFLIWGEGWWGKRLFVHLFSFLDRSLKIW